MKIITAKKLPLDIEVSHLLNLFAWLDTPLNRDRDALAKTVTFFLRKYPKFRYSGPAYRANSLSVGKLISLMSDKRTKLDKLPVYSFSKSKQVAASTMKVVSPSNSRLPEKILIAKKVVGLDVAALLDSTELLRALNNTLSNELPSRSSWEAFKLLRKNLGLRKLIVDREVCPALPTHNMSPESFKNIVMDEKEVLVKKPLTITAKDVSAILVTSDTYFEIMQEKKRKPDIFKAFPKPEIRPFT